MTYIYVCPHCGEMQLLVPEDYFNLNKNFCLKCKRYDIHTEKAAEMFCVDPSKVTLEQRQEGVMYNLFHLYSQPKSEPDTFDTDTKRILSRLKELELQQKLNTRLLKEVCEKTKTIQAGFKKLAKTFAEMAEAFK